MKKTVIFALLAGQLVFAGCGSDGEGASSEVIEAALDDKGQIIKIEDIANKSLADVENVIGKSESTEKVTGYPCEKSDCQKALFQKGKYEIIFKNGKSDRITINQVPDMTYKEDAIETLGLPGIDAHFSNPGTVIKWEFINDIREVSFFTDYILVQVTPTDS